MKLPCSIILFCLTFLARAEQTPASPADSIEFDKELNTVPFQLNEQYKGVVKIEVASLTPNYKTPWQAGDYSSGTGTGFLIGKKLFLTNAHVVSNAERIHISQYGDSRKIEAKVKYVAHDADLALLEVDNFEPFEKLPYLQFAKELPKLEDSVRAIGYPIGGDRLSVTRGIISRIDFTPYSHPRNTQHLTLQVDAAINPGNSGGPVLIGSQVVGVAFQGLNNASSTGYAIPVPVIARFMKDIEDGKYDHYVDMGLTLFPISNPAMRKALGLNDDEKGVLISEVIKGSCASKQIHVGDVMLELEGYPVDSSGMIELEGERISALELIERRFANEKIKIKLLRDKKVITEEITLSPLKSTEILANEFDKMPRYVTSAGFVFQPVQLNVLSAHRIPSDNILLPIVNYMQKGDWLKKEDIVLLSNVLDDKINTQTGGTGNRILKKVNGVEVTGISQLITLLYPEKMPEYFVLEFDEGERPIILEGKQVMEANKRIAEKYQIPSPYRSSAERPQALKK